MNLDKIKCDTYTSLDTTSKLGIKKNEYHSRIYLVYYKVSDLIHRNWFASSCMLLDEYSIWKLSRMAIDVWGRLLGILRHTFVYTMIHVDLYRDMGLGTTLMLMRQNRQVGICNVMHACLRPCS